MESLEKERDKKVEKTLTICYNRRYEVVEIYEKIESLLF